LSKWRGMRKKKTHEQYVRKLAIKNPIFEVVGRYINDSTAILHRCKGCDNKDNLYNLYCRNERRIVPSALLSGYTMYCKKRKHEEYVKKLASVKPMIKSVEMYVSSCEKIRHKCLICSKVKMVSSSYMLQSKSAYCDCDSIVKKFTLSDLQWFAKYIENLDKFKIKSIEQAAIIYSLLYKYLLVFIIDTSDAGSCRIS